eukprot:PLAT7453.1.p1 GENE.PLAT7453.1~~PLAT7453.1.p1  ORF type:complete len:633 (+),score=285.81 PLAT7453.1:52-1899(+)
MADAPPSGPWRPDSGKKLATWRAVAPVEMGLDGAIVSKRGESRSRKGGSRRKPRKGKRRPAGRHSTAKRVAAAVGRRVTAGLLDGFLLLHTAGVELPDDVVRAVVNGRELTDVVEEDLPHFGNLVYLDAGDNEVGMQSLQSLPALEELHLHCCSMFEVPHLSGFRALQVLDLSYNSIDADSLPRLSRITTLRELDLTCNSLRTLPSSFASFRALEVLILERNRLSREEDVLSLAGMPRLRVLNLSYNYLRGMPPSVLDSDGFLMLEWLNLAHNYIDSEEDVLPAVELPRMLRLLVYGNPFTRAHRALPILSGLDTRMLEIVVEPPDAVAAGGRGGPGAAAALSSSAATARGGMSALGKPGRSLYRNLRLYSVPDTPIPTAAEFREAGNRALFSPEWDHWAEEEEEEAAGGGGEPDGHAGGEKKGDEAAHDRDRVGFPPVDGHGGATFLTGLEYEEEDDMSEEEDDGADPFLPELLPKRAHFPTAREMDPAKLRAAINALRYALKHPLTSHSATAASKQYEKTTAAHRARMRKKHVSRKKDAAELAAAAAAAAARKPVLARVEEMLDGMDEGEAGSGGGGDAAEAVKGFGTAVHNDRTMASLIDMVNKVMESYEKV